MSLTQIAVLLAGIYLILLGASVTVTTTLTLIFGIAVAALVVLDASGIRRRI